LLKALWLVQHHKSNAIICIGVYHPREYAWKSTGVRFQQYLVKRVLAGIPTSNIFTMTDTAAEQMGVLINRNLKSCPILPISIDYDRFSKVKRNPIKGRIISIARITSFYTYHFQLIKVIKSLNQNGYDCEFHIYGWGDQSEKLKKAICSEKMENKILLHGPIKYSELENVIEKAFLAIGMGTSLLEIAASKVPTLVGIESNDKPTTHGFLSETLGYEVGGFDEHKKEFLFYDKIEELFKMSKGKYDKLSKKCQERAYEFSMGKIMPQFTKNLEHSKIFSFDMPKFFRLIDFFDLWLWRLLKLCGITDPYAQKGIRK
jgi:1,2-diacylglycerol 3-alpha-glucosyltransferase